MTRDAMLAALQAARSRMSRGLPVALAGRSYVAPNVATADDPKAVCVRSLHIMT